MKRSAELTLCAIVFSLFAGVLIPPANPTFAQTGAEPTTVRSATVDLDGDGKPEKIAVSGTKTSPLRLVLSVNNAKRTETNQGFDSDVVPGFRVVKLDNNSKARQISVDFIQLSGLTQTCFYRWDGKAIHRIGVVENAEKPSGNGTINGSVYMGFWSCKQKYVLNPKTQTLRTVRQSTYSVGIPATVKEPFSILQDHTDESHVEALAAPGSKIQLVKFWSPAADPTDSTEANSWFLIKTATGLSGWTRLTDFKEKVDGLVFGG